jgi:hypothetical protein
MIDPQKINIDALPKKLIDGAIGAHNKEVFTFAFTSGRSLDSFAATPRTMKSIAEWLRGQIALYEKRYGTIDMTPTQIESPIQRSDLSS